MRYITEFLEDSPGIDDIFDTADNGRYLETQEVVDLLNELDALRTAYHAAAAIMRSQPVGIAPRLVQAWREAVEKVEKVEAVTK